MKLENEDEILGSNDTVDELTLVSSMDRLSLQYPETMGLREVEHHLAQVALHDQDSDDTSSEHQTDEECETGREKDVNDKVNEERVVVKVKVQEDEEEVKEVQEDEKVEKEVDKEVTKEVQKDEEEIEKEVDEKEIEKEVDEKEIKKEVQEDEKEVKKEVVEDEKEVKKEEQEEDHSDDENPADEDDESSSGAKKTSRLLRRGWGPSEDNTPYQTVQQDPLYQYGVYDTTSAHTYSYTHNDAVAPVSSELITQYGQSPQYGQPAQYGQLTPQYGQSPGCPDMSPVHGGTTDSSMYSMLPTLQHGQSPYYPNMLPVHSDGINGMNYSLPPMSGVDGYYFGYSESGSPYMIPESPPISSPDENENYQCQGFQSGPPSPEQGLDYQSQSAGQHDLGQVLEVVHQVVNNDEISSAPPSAIATIIMNLTANIGTPTTDLTQIMGAAATNQWGYNEEPSQPLLNSCQPLKPVVDCCNMPPYHEQGLVEQTPDTKWTMTQNPKPLLEARRILARRTNEELIAKDSDGDTPIMILACRNVNDEGYAESLVAIVDRVKSINLCCDMVVNKTGQCDLCGNAAQVNFYSPLSMKNNEGDTVLSSVVKMRHPVSVINYIVEKISHHPNDLRRVFDSSSLKLYFDYRQLYPTLARFFCE